MHARTRVSVAGSIVAIADKDENNRERLTNISFVFVLYRLSM